MMPTDGYRIPPDITAIDGTFTSEPSNGNAGPGAEQGEQRENGGNGEQFFWGVRRLVQQFAKQADTDEKEQADKH